MDVYNLIGLQCLVFVELNDLAKYCTKMQAEPRNCNFWDLLLVVSTVKTIFWFHNLYQKDRGLQNRLVFSETTVSHCDMSSLLLVTDYEIGISAEVVSTVSLYWFQ